MESELKQRVLSGLAWRGLERVGTQAMGFVISIILARMLEPKDYGTIALTAVLIALANVFVNSGFGSALIQKKEITEEDYNSVFYLSLVISFVLYGVLFVAAPWVAVFYNAPVLVWVLRILALSLFVGAISSVQNSILMREMNFKASFKISLISIMGSGIVGISMAYRGFGVWALVGSTMAAQVVSMAGLWKIVSWRPKLIFSVIAIRQLFGFGSKLLVSSLLDTLFNNLYIVIIGKFFNQTVLGHYSRGQSIPNMAMTSVQGTIGTVMFPALAICQHDKTRMKEIVRRSIKSSSFLVFPMMFGLAAVAKPLVLVLLTDKWLPCVPFLQLSCITFALYPVHVANLQAINALGRSDIFLTLEIIKKVLFLLVILFTFRYGVMTMVVGQAVLSPVVAAINIWPNRHLLNYSFAQQVRDVLPAFLLAASMGGLIWWLALGISNSLVLLATQIILGTIIYFAGAVLFRFESAKYLWQTAWQFFQPTLKRISVR